MHEKLENNDLAFQVYSKIVNCDGPNCNLEFVAGAYFAMAKYYYGRNEYVRSRELFVKFFISVKKMHDLNQMMAIPLFTKEPDNIGKLMQESASMLQATGELNDRYEILLGILLSFSGLFESA